MKKKNSKTLQFSAIDIFRFLLIIILVGLIVISTKVLLAQSNYNNNIAYLNSYFLTEYQDFDSLTSAHSLPVYKVKIKNKEYELAVADNSLATRRGLTGVDEMAPNQGMIYAFPEVGQYEFTTRGMKFDLDIVWLDENGKVVHIEKDLEPSNELGYKPTVKAKYVLELKSGTVDSSGLRLGDIVSLPSEIK